MERGQRTESQREPVYWGQKLPTHFSLMLHFHAVEVQPSIHLHPFPFLQALKTEVMSQEKPSGGKSVNFRAQHPQHSLHRLQVGQL